MTVPAMCTSGVRVVLLLDGSARRAREQQADDGVDDRESPDLAAGRPATPKTTRRFGCGLVPNNLLWI